MRVFSFGLCLLSFFVLFSCRDTSEQVKILNQNPEVLRRAERKLTEVVIHDVFGPPIAARIYAYASLAAYEAVVPSESNYKSMAGQYNDLTTSPQPDANAEYCFPLASVRAYLTVGRQLTFSGDKIDDFEPGLYAPFKDALPKDVFERSMAYGEAVGKHIIAYSGKDNYKQLRGFRHTVTNASGTWTPTPPAYMDALEPRWREVRPFVLDSASQFAPPPPPTYSKNKTSVFYKEAQEVYSTVKNLTPEQSEIANFWDCNPFKMNIQGHASFATKKMSPGGHWMSIVGLTTRAAKKNFIQTAEAYLLTSVALFDGFISCWDEKYRSVKLRPESFINTDIDASWQPTLQTPPFPEYTSGHSVISSASAVVLTKLFGDNFTFADSSEVAYGLPVRTYGSFAAAAEEAGISRLYGGIHYRSALTAGAAQGKAVGGLVLQKLQTKSLQTAKK